MSSPEHQTEGTTRAGSRTAPGILALLGGGEWRPGTEALDAELLIASGGLEVMVLPTAAAFEMPDHVLDRARAHFGPLGATVRELRVLNRRDAEEQAHAEAIASAAFIYISDGSPMHLRSVFKGSAVYGAIVAAHARGAVVAASGAGATVLGDPMVDPRGGAYPVGLGLVPNVAIFPYHGTAADHLRERSIEVLPRNAVLVGVDASTAIVRSPEGSWHVAGSGVVTVYANDGTTRALTDGEVVPLD